MTADVSKAFLYGDMKRQVYIELPNEDSRKYTSDVVGLLNSISPCMACVTRLTFGRMLSGICLDLDVSNHCLVRSACMFRPRLAS